MHQTLNDLINQSVF